MEKCRLCQKNDADKTGSHLIPHFLLKRIDNVEGRKERDKELGFIIGEKDTKRYLGKAVLPEQFEPVLGELDDDKLKDLKNPSVEDHIFCTDCEKRLAAIESEYAKTVDIVSADSEYSSKIPSGFAFLFWTSLVWRIAGSPNYGLSLEVEKLELLRKLLNDFLKIELSELDLKVLAQDERVKQLGYRIIRSPGYSDKAYTCLVGDPHPGGPVNLIVDEFVLSYHIDRDEKFRQEKEFFGFEKIMLGKALNTSSTGEIIVSLPFSEFGAAMSKVTSLVVDQRLSFYNNSFDYVHKTFSGRDEPMPQYMKAEIFSKMKDESKKLGERWTHEDMVRSMYEVMKKYSK